MPPALIVDKVEKAAFDGETPSPKRIKLLLPAAGPCERHCRRLLQTTPEQPLPSIPSSLTAKGKTRNNLTQLRALFDDHGFRTSIVESPRRALSVYKDSCVVVPEDDLGKEFLVLMLGLHPDQKQMEHFYASSVKNLYCLMLFCNRLLEACSSAVESSPELAALLTETEEYCRSFANGSADRLHQACAKTSIQKVAAICQLAVQTDIRVRVEQLDHEYDRIVIRNSTLSNAYLGLLTAHHELVIKDVYFKQSHVPKYERITMYLYDRDIDERKPPYFTFLPSLQTAMTAGPEQVARDMLNSFWQNLLRHGYFATSKVKAAIAPELEKYLLSGIAKELHVPFQLNAHFTPSYPLSFYFYGMAGCGKSSLVGRAFSPSLNECIEEHVDPAVVVRFVKQGLNKPMETLQMELEIRPNNNDMSVMAIIQSRQMVSGQTKPGLVMVGLEEMASNRNDADPNQLKTSQLISQRFSGRKGEFKEGKDAPRNSTKRGISGDATIIPVFTSNYKLEDPCREALQKLEMFQNLKSVEAIAVSGKDRMDFASQYLLQTVKDRFNDHHSLCKIALDVPIGEGDTRPLVRHLRMLAFYVCTLIADTAKDARSIEVSVVQKGDHCWIMAGKDSLELKLGSMENLYPVTSQIFDPRTRAMMARLKNTLSSNWFTSELTTIVDFWLAGTLAPAVIVSNDAVKVKAIVEAARLIQDVQCIADVDASEYKMMKSLYDSTGTPNLRDDILQFGKGAFVAVELLCESVDAQLCIREIIEDTPSMTAFSSEKSALYKSGLLFAVYVDGEITPEVESRASLVI